MMNPSAIKSSIRSCGGLTLIEILVSMTLFAGIALITVVALRTGLRAADTGIARIASVERIRTALEIMSAQIESAVPLVSGSGGSRKSLFRGDRLSLSFPSARSIWEGPRGNVLCEYRIEPDPGGALRLVGSEKVIGTDYRRETIFLKGLTQAGFSYASGDNGSGTWEESWSRDLTLPRRVRITFNSRAHQGDIVISIKAGGG